jgi:hypothetical protein
MLGFNFAFTIIYRLKNDAFLRQLTNLIASFFILSQFLTKIQIQNTICRTKTNFNLKP